MKNKKEWYAALSKEEKAAYNEKEKQEAESRRWQRQNKRDEQTLIKEVKFLIKRELTLLKFMYQNDVLHYHHGKSESTKDQIKEEIDYITSYTKRKDYVILHRYGVKGEELRQYYPKKHDIHDKYDPYVWNRLGQGNNHLPRAQFGCLWKRVDNFETIYDVPLDGTYKFHIFDSGQRGLGSFHYITATKVEAEVKVPKVSPGSFPPIYIP